MTYVSDSVNVHLNSLTNAIMIKTRKIKKGIKVERPTDPEIRLGSNLGIFHNAENINTNKKIRMIRFGVMTLVLEI